MYCNPSNRTAMPLLSPETIRLAVLTLASIALYWARRFGTVLYHYWRHSRSPLRNLPGPRDTSSWIYGHLGVLASGEDMEALAAWASEHGESFAIRGAFGKNLLITTDLRALTHITFASYVFQRPAADRRNLESFLGGQGLIWVEGEQHKNQRRILSPAFGHAQVRDMTPLFLDDSAKMLELWNTMCITAGGTARIDAIEWLSKAALAIIARAGFDYDMGSLEENAPKTRMAEAFEELFRVDNTPKLVARNILNNQLPFLRKYFPDERALKMDECRKTIDEIGMQILHDKKTAILAEGGGTEKSFSGGKDLMSLLLRANLAPDLDPSLRLSDEEVLAQIPTFLAAGHETISNSVSWAMYSLAKNPAIQTKLRTEVQRVATEMPTLDVLNNVPYLDQVVRETLRFHVFLPFVPRTACKEDLIPLGRPMAGRDGKILEHIHIHEGDEIIVPIWLVNRSKSIWGPDADQFRPERWADVPADATAIPGISPALMTFIGGPRGCIGHRFAIAEMKVLLFQIVRRFEFQLAVDPSEIWTRSGPLLHPQLRSDNSVQLPMFITPVV